MLVDARRFVDVVRPALGRIVVGVVRQEAVDDRALRADEARVGEADRQARHERQVVAPERHTRRLAHPRREVRARPVVGRGARHRRVVDDEADTGEPCQEFVQLRAHVGFVLVGQGADVAGNGAAFGDAVGLHPGIDHRRHEGHPGHRLQRRGPVDVGPFQLGGDPVDVRGGDRLGDAVELRQSGDQFVIDVSLRLVSGDPADDLLRLVDGVVGPPRLRGVPAAPLHRDDDLQTALLAGADQIGELAIRRLDERPAPLVKAEIGGQALGMMLGQPAEAPCAARLFVRSSGEDHVAAQFDPGAFEEDQRHRLGGDGRLHVVRATPVDAPVVDLGPERRVIPGGLVLDRDDIGVREEEEARRTGAPRQSGDQVTPVRSRFQDVGGDPVRRQLIAQDDRGGGLVPGRHHAGIDRWYAHECLTERDDLLARGLDGGQEFLPCRHAHSFLRCIHPVA